MHTKPHTPKHRCYPAAWIDRSHAAGVTFGELIVVVSLITILLGTMIPGMVALRQTSQEQIGVNTVRVAVASIRAYATLDQPNLEDTGEPDFAGLRYKGTAVLFTPAGEIRMLEHNQAARSGSDANTLIGPNRIGFADIPGRDYVMLPQDVGVVGIARGAGLYLFTPPFAVRFNKHGHLIAGRTDGRYLYYDSDDSGVYSVSINRTSRGDYNPDHLNFTRTNGRYDLPDIEKIDTVFGVAVYSKSQLRRAMGQNAHTGSGAQGSLEPGVRDWILENGHVLLFNRYTGDAFRL